MIAHYGVFRQTESVQETALKNGRSAPVLYFPVNWEIMAEFQHAIPGPFRIGSGIS
jgi:hypothetical protein